MQRLFVHRSSSFVWFLIYLFNPFLLLLFWQGKIAASPGLWSNNDITSYYLLLVIAGTMLLSHAEVDVAEWDIRDGNLVKYLLRPFSYFWFKFDDEIGDRILQGFFGIIVLLLATSFFPSLIHITQTPITALLSILIAVCGLLMSFLYKLILGFIAFWSTEIRGLYQASDFIILIFAGYIVPLNFFPTYLQNISNSMPFAYMIYYPIRAFQGNMTLERYFQILGIQLVWIMVLYCIYKVLWNAGIKKYTGVGQ